MKKLLILVLALGLAAAMFLTRPTKADFEQYARQNKLSDTQRTGGPTIVNQIEKQMRTFADTGSVSLDSPTDQFLKKLTYTNYFLWTNVKEGDQVIYTGAVGHWFPRNGAPQATTKTS